MENTVQVHRYFFEVSYDGKGYHGWQKQENAITVQGEIENQLAKLFPIVVNATGSGRTDTGVHCEQQFFHADLPGPIECYSLAFKLNCMLPSAIAIREIFPVRPDAHARFDAQDRTYEYRITHRKDPFLAGRYYWYRRDINVKQINQACDILKSHTDFETFSRVKTEVNHFRCDITEALWEEKEHGWIFRVTANRFLRGMVRTLVGTLLEIGEGKRTLQSLEKTILAKDRKQAGPAVPPDGLYLVRVRYSDLTIPHERREDQ